MPSRAARWISAIVRRSYSADSAQPCWASEQTLDAAAIEALSTLKLYSRRAEP